MTRLAVAPVTGRHFDGEPLRQGNPINLANPNEKRWARHRYLLSFGCVGSTHVLVYGDSIDDALEVAAKWLAENELWGHITPHTEVRSSDDLGCDCGDPFDCDSHTYTESGWLTSWEWFVSEPSDAELVKLNRG